MPVASIPLTPDAAGPLGATAVPAVRRGAGPLLGLLVLASILLPPEASSVLALVVVAGWLLVDRLQVPRGVVLLLPLAAVVGLGLVGAIGRPPWDVAREVWYLGKAVVLLAAGYLLGWRMTGAVPLLRLVLICALVGALEHLLPFVLDPAILEGSLAEIRSEVGGGSPLTPLALAALAGAYRAGVRPFRTAGLTAAVLVASVFSMVLSMSRTNLVMLAIMLFVTAGGLRLVSRSAYTLHGLLRIAVIAAAVLLVAGLGWRLGAETVQGQDFMRKLARSLDEIAVADYGDRKMMNENWRGYEAYRSWIEYREGSALEHAIGRGFGALTDVGVHMNLGGSYTRYLPMIHNGYVYLLLKTGIVGLALYLLFFYRAARLGLAVARPETPPALLLGGLIVAVAAAEAAATLVVSGLMRKSNIGPILIFGALLALAHRERLAARPRDALD